MCRKIQRVQLAGGCKSEACSSAVLVTRPTPHFFHNLRASARRNTLAKGDSDAIRAGSPAQRLPTRRSNGLRGACGQVAGVLRGGISPALPSGSGLPGASVRLELHSGPLVGDNMQRSLRCYRMWAAPHASHDCRSTLRLFRPRAAEDRPASSHTTPRRRHGRRRPDTGATRCERSSPPPQVAASRETSADKCTEPTPSSASRASSSSSLSAKMPMKSMASAES